MGLGRPDHFRTLMRISFDAPRRSTPQRAKRLAAAVVLALVCTSGGAVAAAALAPFTTDGCSLFPDRALVGRADWCHCCLAHDLAYWRGGTADERLQADLVFRACVQKESSDPALAETMYLGGPALMTPFRWGYGWPRGRFYAPLSADEAASAVQGEAAYRAANPALQCAVKP
jgi:hypothetical protein